MQPSGPWYLRGTPARATFPGANGQIAFESDRDGELAIWVMNADGSGPAKLTNDPAEDFDPVWTPDGARIAFTSERDGNRGIYVMNADGTNPVRLTNNIGQDFRPAWSPDGHTTDTRRRTTARLRETVAGLASEATVRAVARAEGVSEGLVERSWVEKHSVVRAPVSPHVLLGLDGFCVRRPGRMWTGMWDLETKDSVAFVPGERQVDVQKMLERHASRETVRAVAIDLSEALRQAVELVLPDALVVADKFHVVALAGRSLREVHGEKRRRGSVAWLLQWGGERLDREERERLLEALTADPSLGRAWGLKEGLRVVYKKQRGDEAAAALERWISEAQASGLRPFQRTAATLKKWRRELLNYWRYPITNALVEGKHNRIKTLKRRAYGYRNDRSFLLKILGLMHTD